MEQYKKTLVVDSSYMARSIITSERAFVITYKGNAEVLYNYPETFGIVNPNLEINKPSVIRVSSYINQPFQKAPLTRHNVFKRDNYECVYCGESNRKLLTWDHVLPQSKGGSNTWNNLVTACKRCNNEKGDLLLEEYGKDIEKPMRPHYLMLLKKVHTIPDEWKDFLFF